MKTSPIRTALVALLTCAACATSAAPTDGPAEQTGSHGQAIINGQESGPEQNYTVQIRAFKPESHSATGVLIAPNLVVTAQHVISTTESIATNDLGCDPGNQTTAVYATLASDKVKVFVGQKNASPNAVPPSPTKQLKVIGTLDICQGDMGFIILENDLTDVPFAPIRLDGPPAVPESIFAVGWGMYAIEGAYPKMRQTMSGMTVQALGPGNFQPPNGPKTYGLSPAQIASDGASCLGDSGSGIFATSSGALLGIIGAIANADPTKVSTKDQPGLACVGATSFSTRIDKFRAEILDAFKTAGHAPWREGKPKPLAFAGECTEDLDCDSMLCVLGHCSSSCADKACGDGFTCTDQPQGKACTSPDWTPVGAGGNGGQAGEGPGVTLKAQGESCQLAAECASGLCLTLSQGGVCSSSCDAAACENKWECASLDGRNVCVPPSGGGDDGGGCSVQAPVEGPSRAPALAGLGLLAGALLLRRRSR